MPAQTLKLSHMTTDARSIVKTEFAVNGRKGEVTTYMYAPRGQRRQEIYRECDDTPGLMVWLGYYDEICHTMPKVCEIVHPYVQVNRAFVAKRDARWFGRQAT